MRFCFTIVLVLFISCRKKVNPEPLILISSPASGQPYSPGDTIRVSADVSDDDNLASATLKLLNAAYTPVDHQESIVLNATSGHIEFDYVIQNNYLETGNYHVTLSVSDGTNVSNEFRTIVIHEIPKTRKAVYVLTRPDSGHVVVSTLDAANQLMYEFTIAGDYSGSAISSRFNRLNVAGKITGSFSQYDLNTNSLISSIPPYNSLQPSFMNLFFTNELTFVSYYDGRIRAFDKDGHAQFNSAQPVYYQPGVLCANSKYVFAESYYPGTGENRLVVLHYPSGVAKQEINTGFEIVAMASVAENEVVVFGNSNGDGKIYIFYVNTNSIDELHTLFNKRIYSARSTDNDRFGVGTSDGLYSFQLSSNNLLPAAPGEPVYSLEYDQVNGVLLANCGRKINAYAFPDAAVLYSVSSADSLLEIRILYSK